MSVSESIRSSGEGQEGVSDILLEVHNCVHGKEVELEQLVAVYDK